MIGLAGSEHNIMFGFGPTEIGVFMTGVGELRAYHNIHEQSVQG